MVFRRCAKAVEYLAADLAEADEPWAVAEELGDVGAVEAEGIGDGGGAGPADHCQVLGDSLVGADLSASLDLGELVGSGAADVLESLGSPGESVNGERWL